MTSLRPRERRLRLSGVLVLAALLLAAGCAGCASSRRSAASTGPAPAPTSSAAVPSTQIDFRDAEKVVLAYLGAVRRGDAEKAAVRLTRNRRSETRDRDWESANAWWKQVRVTAVSRPGRYLTDERTFAQLYAARFGHAPYKLVVMNVAYGATISTPPGDVDFVLTQDVAHAPWLINDYGGAVFAH